MTQPANVCRLMSFFIGVLETCFMSNPIGTCDYCCQHNDAMDITYKLYTRSNPQKFQVLPQGDAQTLAASNLNLAHPTVIYLMGFSESSTGLSTITMRNAYLSQGDCNFIAVDWSRLVAFPWPPPHFTTKTRKCLTLPPPIDKTYVSAVRNTRYMGTKLADFVQFLNGTGIPTSSLHVVGFSLGAEAAGFGGKALRARGLTLGRITGLDPAYPGYSFSNSDGHLAKGDATFVDVLHTNPGVFGFPQAIGDVDFYPNPGKWIQPGCWVDELLKNRELGYLYGCSHNRAWRLYAESVLNPASFPATACVRWRGVNPGCKFRPHGYMGFGARLPMSGKMYLETNSKSPYGKYGP